MAKPSFWEDNRRAQEVIRERTELARLVARLKELGGKADDLTVALEPPERATDGSHQARMPPEQITNPNGGWGPEKTLALEPGSSSAMNSAQLRTNPISPDSGTYSPKGTSWILSYRPTMPRSVRRNAVLRTFGGVDASTSIEPTRSGT